MSSFSMSSLSMFLLSMPSSNALLSRVRRVSNIRWKDTNTQLIVQWLCKRDEKDVSVNLNAFQKENKMKATKKMLMNIDLINLRSNISKEKERDKLTQMIKLLKETKALTKAIDWEIDSIKHDVVVDNIKEMIIREVLIKKCSFYYEFEEIMSDLSIITRSFVMKFIQFDVFEFQEASRMKEDSNKDTQDNQFANEDDWNSQNNAEEILFEDDVFLAVFELIKKKFDLMKRVKQSKLQKRTSTFVFIKRSIDVNFDDEATIEKKRNFKNRIVTNVLIEMQSMKFKNFFQQFEFKQSQLQKRFDVETKQKDQHHKKTILKQKEMIVVTKMQHEEIMIRLHIELKKTSQTQKNQLWDKNQVDQSWNENQIDSSRDERWNSTTMR